MSRSMQSSRRLRWCLLLVVALLLAACGGDADDTAGDGADAAGDGADDGDGAEPYFAGRTITFIVPFSAGGGTDGRARLLAKHLAEHIEGQPEIQVENVEGGGGAIGMNEVAQSEPDGTTIAISSPSIPLRWIRGAEGHDYDLASMNVHGAFRDPCMYYLSTAYAEANGISSPGDLADAESPARMGYTDAAGGLPILNNLVADLTGAPLQAIPGYGGSSEALIAVASGELDGSGASVSVYLESIVPYVEDGEMQPLFQCGVAEGGELLPMPGVEDMPTVADFMDETGTAMEGTGWDAIYANIQIQSTLSQAVWSPAGTPDEAIRALNEGFVAATSSDAYVEEAVEQLDTDGSPVDGETAQGELDTLAEIVTDEVLERWDAAVAEE